MRKLQTSDILIGGGIATVVLVGLAAVLRKPAATATSDGETPPAPPPQPVPSTFADTLVATAQSDLGLVETSTNGGPRIDQMLANFGVSTGNNWCAAAVGTWIRETAAQLGVSSPIAGSAGALATMQQFQDTSNPRVAWIDVGTLRADSTLIQTGMVPVFKRGAVGSGFGHIDIVEENLGGGNFRTIDGNSGPASDRVYENVRTLNDSNLLGMGVIKETSGALGYLVDPPGFAKFTDEEPKTILTHADFARALEMAAQGARCAVQGVEDKPGIANVKAAQGGIQIDAAWLSKHIAPLPVNERWAALVGVAAHELGHYQPGGQGYDQIASELYADGYAGRALRELGLPTEPLKKVLRGLKKTPDHPVYEDRAGAVGKFTPIPVCPFGGYSS